MLIDLSLLLNSGAQSPIAERPIRMGFFHFPNNNLSIRKQCARDVGMYDPVAQKGEDVDLCFRVALNPKWVAWRENAAIVRHKGRPSLRALLEQMWGWGLHLGYPYSKTGVRGVFMYLLNGRDHTIVGRFESEHFPLLVCAFATDFYLVNALMLLLIWAVCFGHLWIGLLAIAGLLWAAPRYLYDVMHVGLDRWSTFKLAVVHYLANLAFTISAFWGALQHREILLAPSVFKLDGPESPLNLATKFGERQPLVRVRGADSYAPAADLWVVTCYFNPQSYATRLENYHRFKAAFERSEARFIVVECAFDNQPFVLPGSNVIRLRASDVMWQKERLLNFAISKLPPECQKVAWLDCDILFQDPAWLVQTSKLLDDFALIQPFQKVLYPAKGDSSYSSDSIAFRESFGSSFSSASTKPLPGNFWKHGHTGFAWAARRDLLKNPGLYEACIVGDGDHVMAHAAYGDWDSACVHNCIVGQAHRNHFRQWAAEFYKDAQGQIGYAAGTVLHLWHGEIPHKGAYQSLVKLQTHEFDPTRDIRIGSTGALEWNSSKPELHRSLQNYFASRREDG
jgi:hypothetical protein